jgi:hypothetical protein
MRKAWTYFTKSTVTNRLAIRRCLGGVGGLRDGDEIGVEDPECEEIDEEGSYCAGVAKEEVS